QEPLFVYNRPASRPSHEGSAPYLLRAVRLCRQAGFVKISLRGDGDFALRRPAGLRALHVWVAHIVSYKREECSPSEVPSWAPTRWTCGGGWLRRSRRRRAPKGSWPAASVSVCRSSAA